MKSSHKISLISVVEKNIFALILLPSGVVVGLYGLKAWCFDIRQKQPSEVFCKGVL